MPERLKSFLVPCIAAMASVGSALLLDSADSATPGKAVPAVSGRCCREFPVWGQGVRGFGDLVIGRNRLVVAATLSSTVLAPSSRCPLSFHRCGAASDSFGRVKSETARREEADAGLRASELSIA